jgi:hypothetical protein
MKESIFLYGKPYEPGIRILLNKAGDFSDSKKPPDTATRWAKNIPDDVMNADINTLILIWHMRFPEPPTPEQVIEAGNFYYEVSRFLWINRKLHKDIDKKTFDTLFIVDAAE